MEDKLYEKVDNICQRINSYAEKDISVKNKVKTEIYIDKIKKLINMIETAEGNAATPRARTKIEEVNSENILDDKYNPYGENFCYKERLEKLGGDINKLIEELKDEDKMGYRNAYIIKNIENNININKHNVKVIDVSKNNAVNKTLNNNKMSLWDKIKSIFK